MNRKALGLCIRAAGVLLLWTIVSSATFVLVGRLWSVYPPPSMFWQWWHYALFSDRSPVTLRLLGISAAIPSLLLIAGGIRALWHVGQTRKPSLYGETVWATDQQAEQAGFRFCTGLAGGGIVLGRHESRDALLTFPGDEHVVLYAPTRTGKGISLVIPNCLRWPDSLICLDLKRENWKATAGARMAMGQRVFLFDPLAPSGETARYNPFSYIDRDSPDAFNQLQMLGTTIFPEPPESNAQFWVNAARGAWIGAAALVAETPVLPFTMEQVLDFFTRPDATAVVTRMIEQALEGGHPYTRACVRSLSDYIASSTGRTDLYDSIRKSVSTRLALWQNSRICAATEESDFDLRLLRQEKISIYVAVAPGDIERLSPLLAIFFQQVVNTVCRTLPEDDPTVRHHVLMLLDEFPTIGAMPHLAKAFAFVAGYWLRIALVLQDPPQLDGVYGRDMAKTILDNCGCEVVFGTKNQDLTESLSKRVGDNTTTAVTEQRPRFWASLQWGKQSESEHPHRRPLMLPQEIARLSDAHQLVIRRGVGPIRARKIRWYEDRVFSVLRLPAPNVAPITVLVPMDSGSATPSGGGTGTRRMDLADGPEQVVTLARPGRR